MIYLCGLTISNLGSGLTVFVLPLLILDITGSPIQLSIVSGINLLPYVILGLPFGAIVDRINLKKLMKLCDIIRFSIYLLLFLGYFFMPINMVIICIYIVSAISGVCFVCHSIAETTAIPYIVESKDLSKANSLIYGSQYATSLIGPFLGGILYSVESVGYFFLFDSITFLVSFFLLTLINRDLGKRNNRVMLNIGLIYDDVIQGIKILAQDKLVLHILIIITGSNLLLASYYNYLIVYFKNVLLLKPENIGLIITITSIASLIGALIAPIISKKIEFKKLFLILIFIDGICRSLVIFMDKIEVLVTLISITYFTQSVLNIIVITMRQQSIPQEYLGRVNSVFKTIVIGVRPIGLLIGGWSLTQIEAESTLLITGIGSLVLFLYGFAYLKKKEVVKGNRVTRSM